MDEMLERLIAILDQFKETDLRLLVTILQGGINTPKTSSLGRLFDSVSAMLGVCSHASYEGQPAIARDDRAVRSELVHARQDRADLDL